MRILSIVLGFVCLSSVATAQFVEFQTTLPLAPVPSTQNAQLSAFDPDWGVLRSVEVTVAGWVTGTLAFENTNASAASAPHYYVGAYVSCVGANGFFSPQPNPTFEYTPFPAPSLGAFDGTLDFAGTSALTIPFTNEGGTGAPSITTPVFSDGSLPAWIGPAGAPGVLSFTLGTSGHFNGTLPSGVQETHTTTAGITLRVRYNYLALPAAICRGLAFSGCPCGNASGGGGCRNSTAGTNGGVLAISGNASLSNDTLQLLGSGMPGTAPVLYFQGTSFSLVQIPLGDGLLCVGGSLIRLGVKFNVGGASSYPSGDPQVSVAGAVGAPGNRYYQAYYRDTAVFCTAATHNLTNGYAVAWLP